MVRYIEESKLASNYLAELSEECQLSINGGCSNSYNGPKDSVDVLAYLLFGDPNDPSRP